jgi:organic radical activating enzyme
MSPNKLWRPAIEFNLAEHCNLRCTHCDQAAPMLATKFADLESFARDIEVLSTVLQAGELKFGGGEPLLHPQLVDFLRVAKDVQIANRLILLTNGTLLHKAPDELWDLIDGMWISIYPGVKHRFDWDWIQQMADEHQIWVWRKETPEFSERLLVEEIRNEELVRMVFQNCSLAHLESCHTIHEGRYYMCSPSVWMEPRLALRGITFENRESDGVAIHDNASLYEDLDNLIRRQEPLEACRYCLGSWARSTANVQLTRKGTEEFLARQPDHLADLVDPVHIVPRSLTEQNRPR